MSESVPAKRGRKPDLIYGKLVELFVESGSEVAEIDWRAMGRKPDAVQHGLNAVIKRLDLADTLRVSLLDGGETLLLRRRTAKTNPSKSETVQPAAAIQSAGGSGIDPEDVSAGGGGVLMSASTIIVAINARALRLKR